MSQINFSLDLVNSILQYLGNRPYVEVIGFIDQIKREASVQGISSTESTPSTVPVPVEASTQPVAETAATDTNSISNTN